MAKYILVNNFNPLADQFCVLLSISVPDQQISDFIDHVKRGDVIDYLSKDDIKFDLYAVEMVYYLLCVYFLILADSKNYDYVSWIQLVDAFCSSEKVKIIYPIPIISESQPDQLKVYINSILNSVLHDDSNKLPKQAIDLLLSAQSISLAVDRLKKLGDSFYRGEFFSYCFFDLKQGLEADNLVSVFAPKYELSKIRSSNIKNVQLESRQVINWDYHLIDSEMEKMLSNLLNDVIDCLNSFAKEEKYDNDSIISFCAHGVLEHVWMANSRLQMSILDASLKDANVAG